MADRDFESNEAQRQWQQFQDYQQHKSNKKKGWLWGCGGCGGCLVLLILIIIGISACTASFSNSNNSLNSNNTEQQSSNDSDATREQKSALNKAKTYSDVMHMSKQGIYDQLISDAREKFPEDAAQYAIDNLKVDYKKNALEKAKD